MFQKDKLRLRDLFNYPITLYFAKMSVQYCANLKKKIKANDAPKAICIYGDVCNF